MCISQIGSGEHLGDGFLIIVCLQVGAASRVSQCLSLCENKSTEMCQKINQTEACLCSLWWLWMCSSFFFFPLHCAQRLYVKLGNYFKETSNIWYNQ